MKKYMKLVAVSLIALTLLKVSTFAAGSGNNYAATVGARMHSDHSVFTELPYGDNDVSYLLAIEGREEDGFWQIGVDYAPAISGNDTTDYVITPQLNLLWQDRYFFGGIGALQSYVSDSIENDWTDLYWQFTVGLQIPFGGIDISLQTYYAFDKWDDLGDFKGKDLDYGVSLSYRF
jgi:hypothetical protein